jgi:uncharacterized protein (TIGR02246 family)
MQDDERQIRELVATWMRATQAGDPDTILGLMTDDAQFLVAGRPPFGKEAFAASAADFSTSDVAFDGKSEILEIQVAGTWAFMTSRLTVITRRPGAKDMVPSGHTLTVLTKRSGRWQLHRDANLLVSVEGDDAGDA